MEKDKNIEKILNTYEVKKAILDRLGADGMEQYEWLKDELISYVEGIERKARIETRQSLENLKKVLP